MTSIWSELWLLCGQVFFEICILMSINNNEIGLFLTTCIQSIFVLWSVLWVVKSCSILGQALRHRGAYAGIWWLEPLFCVSRLYQRLFYSTTTTTTRVKKTLGEALSTEYKSLSLSAIREPVSACVLRFWFNSSLMVIVQVVFNTCDSLYYQTNTTCSCELDVLRFLQAACTVFI